MQNRYDERHLVWEGIRQRYEVARMQILGTQHKEIWNDYKIKKITLSAELVSEKLGAPPIEKDFLALYTEKSKVYIRQVSKALWDELIKIYPELVKTKENYRAEKSIQYREQFKEDFREDELQIDSDPDLKVMAQNDIKRIIQSFYGVTETKNRKDIGRPSKEQLTYEKEVLKHGAQMLGTFIIFASVGIYDIYKVSFSNDAPSKMLNLATAVMVFYVLNTVPQQPKNNWEITLKDIVYAHQYKSYPENSFPNYKTRLQNETITDARNY